MIRDEQHIEFFKKIAQDQTIVLIKKDYGSIGLEKLLLLTNTINKIYKYLNYSSFSKIIIYTVLTKELNLENLEDSNCKVYQSYRNLAQISGNELTIEVRENLELFVSVNFVPPIELLRSNSVMYLREQTSESIFGKSEERSLIPIPNAESYFAIQTYKELDEALNDYQVKVARYSDSCEILATVWFDLNKIFFSPKPESKMRDSLTYFLKMTLRNTEVRPEQIVDKSHPVDIKITWGYTNDLALIEIKWLGKSLEKWEEKVKSIYNYQRARDGAKQLSDYLDANKIQAPDKRTKGYLVVFDGRRWGTNSSTKEISTAKGLYYENKDINYNPDYHKARNDFAKPIRFFMEPNVAI